MNRLFRICTLLLALFLIGSLTPIRPAHPQAAFYKYVDKDGNVHFTDRLDSIPEEYRNQIKVYRGEEKPKPALPKEQGVTEEQNRGLRETEGEKKEEQKKKEEEQKALQEKAAREQKLKERQEIQDRISSVEEQIRAKEEEKAPLWSSGMVNDRLRLNQLNAEISDLVRELRSLQQELYDKEKR